MTNETTWFDTPNPQPKRRRPMAELIVELGARNGDPVWPVEPVTASSIVPRKAAS